MNKRKHRGYWTKEKCHEEALKYNNKKDFRASSYHAYNSAHKKKWINEICCHMNIHGNEFYRFIYVFEFEDKSCYIGLTQNIKVRENEHLSCKKSQIYKHIQKINSKYILKQINNYPVIKDEAQILEHNTILKYIEDGWNILNKGTTGKGIGSLGGNTLKWTKEKCAEAALNCKNKDEFKKLYSGAHNSARKNKWLDEICSHMLKKQEKKGYWTKDTCKEHAKLCETRNKFKKKYFTAYNKCIKNKWLDEFFPKK